MGYDSLFIFKILDYFHYLLTDPRTKYICVSDFYDLSAFVGCWSSVSISRIIYNFF